MIPALCRMKLTTLRSEQADTIRFIAFEQQPEPCVEVTADTMELLMDMFR